MSDLNEFSPDIEKTVINPIYKAKPVCNSKLFEFGLGESVRVSKVYCSVKKQSIVDISKVNSNAFFKYHANFLAELKERIEGLDYSFTKSDTNTESISSESDTAAKARRELVAMQPSHKHAYIFQTLKQREIYAQYVSVFQNSNYHYQSYNKQLQHVLKHSSDYTKTLATRTFLHNIRE
eukprot:TRINITY_DN7374_c0_g1_i3.p1 TRINITY_DN7374_c0_g1~~TRINITY_DN7374_c0_g1_i3.p1  ORF type:complete len:179 (-),score=3.82 TRINITY_DN7374_c0_g1_i3:466-1002(-)